MFSILIGDTDNFKSINDWNDHDSGDRVLVRTANHLRKALRSQDVTARRVGEKFLSLLPDTDLKGATTLAERIRSTVGAPPCTLTQKPISLLLNRQLNRPTFVIPDLIRDPGTVWIPVCSGMTIAKVINCRVNSMTIGVSTYRGDGNIYTCISRAGQAIYQGKATGKNRVVNAE